MVARSSLTLVTTPSAEPVTLAEVKNWIKQDGNDDDALITALIGAARESAERYLRRALITQTWRLTLDLEQNNYARDLPGGVYDMPITVLYGGLPDVIELPLPPLQSVTSVTTYDLDNTGTVYDASNYFVDTAGSRIVLKQDAVWPGTLRSLAACEVVFKAGYGDDATLVPQGIKTAILMHLQKMYDERIVCDMPASCQSLLSKYRVYGERM